MQAYLLSFGNKPNYYAFTSQIYCLLYGVYHSNCLNISLTLQQLGHIFKMSEIPDYDAEVGDGKSVKVKVICLGDSAVGKSK